MAFEFMRVSVFGWVVHRKRLNAGEQFTVDIPEAYEVKDAGNISLWTRGLVNGVNLETGEHLPARVPGSSVLQKDRVLAGKFLFTATLASEFWCINSTINRNKLPNVEVLDLKAGEQLAGAVKLLLCCGSFTTQKGVAVAPEAVGISDGLTATDRVLGFKFL